MPKAPKEAEINFKTGHGTGQTSITYIPGPDGELCLLTSGGDGKACLRDKATLEVKHSFESTEGPVNVVAVDQAAPTIAIGNDQFVKVRIGAFPIQLSPLAKPWFQAGAQHKYTVIKQTWNTCCRC